MIELRTIPDMWRRWDVTVRDLPFALVLAVGSLIPALHGLGTQVGGVPNRPYDALAIAAVVLQSLPLVVRRRWPDVCLALVVIGFAIDQLRGYHTFAGAGLAIAVLSIGAHLDRFRRTAIVVATAAYAVLAVALDRNGGGERPDEYVTFYLALVLIWGVGAWLRSARAAEAEHRLRVAADTRAAERARIARELHDVVTHHVTAMVVQAEAARYLTAAPDRLDGTLSAITDTGRSAITDLRHLLDVLNPDHGGEFRTPSVDDLGTLVEQTRRAGQPVEFVEEGRPLRSTGSAEFTTYRVVQEALTNALKYAHGSRTEVRVHYGEGEISVEVGNDGSGSRSGSPGGSGRGLTGLGERVETLGGEFSAAARADGGFTVRARIPAESAS
ncbi:integral membrane sensor signal transduction histidine kinase [Mycobacterium tuberculosis]|nr:integral membrane sensor signal transduction histidine kinase [Mycobacterium tuberculosis]